MIEDCGTTSKRSPHSAEQQVLLWMLEGDQACIKRRFIKGIAYYQKALELARGSKLHDMRARLCRDLAYVHLHNGGYQKALAFVKEGLATETDKAELRLGLLVNKVNAYLMMQEYRKALETIQGAVDYFKETYLELRLAPSDYLATYASLLRMQKDLSGVVEILEAGVNPDRIKVTIRLAPPPWISSP